ncbi:CpaF family protein [Desulfofundulus thermosubterraneus]|uniref:Pilus assembly protein CpaF n=1 Tax=Desulfofundulus thermosubterraneus DSM 16057 TaxID=1121432 RepID=A0A1M6D857_9FIRM|nr:CpaF family protein [Desulfofundulus thermosubterraneus]SHI69417.1 pilus assembly protein CpaF [Desulfofundulus thermosubterraneus DSM 16057]
MSLMKRLGRTMPGLPAGETETTSEKKPAVVAGREEDEQFSELKGKIFQQIIEDLEAEMARQDARSSKKGREAAGGQKKQEIWQRDVLAERVDEIVGQVLEAEEAFLPAAVRQKVVEEMLNDVLGYGPIQPLLDDPTISEIMVNGPYKVYVERKGKLTLTDVKFRNNEHVMHVIEKIVAPLGRRIDESMPMVDARLPDGSRVNAIIPPLALTGPTITIRKFSRDPLQIQDLIRFGSLTPEMARFLEACVKARLNIVVSGGTGSGKTTMLNVLSSFIPEDERIVTIEDSAELQLRQEHVVTLESRPPNIEGKGAITIRDLVKNALRMRPDRIVVGEVRSGEALDMLQAMNTGHDGSLTTGHANSPRDMLSRLETMVLMAGMDLPVRAIREQIASAVDLIVQQSRLKDGSRKVTHITEVLGMEGETIVMQDIFIFEQTGVDEMGRVVGRFTATGIRPRFMPRLEAAGISLPPDIFARR